MRLCATQIIGHSALISSVRRQRLVPRYSATFNLSPGARQWESSKSNPWAALENNRIESDQPEAKRDRKGVPKGWGPIYNSDRRATPPLTPITSRPKLLVAKKCNRLPSELPTAKTRSRSIPEQREPVQGKETVSRHPMPETSKPNPWGALENNRTACIAPPPAPSILPPSKRSKNSNKKARDLRIYRRLIERRSKGELIEKSRAPPNRLVPKTRRQTVMDHDPFRPETPISEFTVDSKLRTIETTIGNLPVSPIMDPGYWDAKEKYKRSKPPISDEPMYSVIKQFRKNPFAHALATPLRQCSMSKAHLPKFFLQNFNVLKHPDTQRPWWVPNLTPPDLPEGTAESDLTDSSSDTDFSEPFSSDQAYDPTDLLESQFSTQAAEAQQAQADKAHADLVLRKNKTIPAGPKTNALARRDLLRAFTQAKSGFEGGENRLLGSYSGKTRNMAHGAVWRVDMDSVVLDLLRQDIMADLIYIANLTLQNKREKRHHIEEVPGGWEGIDKVRRGAVLWFRGPSSPAEMMRGREEERIGKEEEERKRVRREREEEERASRDVMNFLDTIPEEGGSFMEDKSTVPVEDEVNNASGRCEKRVPGPGPCAILTLRGKTLLGDAKEESVLVHNIPHLLGAEHTRRLRRDAKIFRQRGDLFVASGKKCIGLQVKLWKLQGYLTDYKTPLGWTWSDGRDEL